MRSINPEVPIPICHASAGWHPFDDRVMLRAMKPGWVYIMANKPHGTLYIGVTSDVASRVLQHRDGTGSDFCRKYSLTRLVYLEAHNRIDEAIAREKAMKAWKRAWKIRLIEEANPEWEDLFERINA